MLELGESLLDFIEEGSGDAGGGASGSMDGDGDAVGNTAFKLCQIGKHRVHCVIAKVSAESLKVRPLVGA